MAKYNESRKRLLQRMGGGRSPRKRSNPFSDFAKMFGSKRRDRSRNRVGGCSGCGCAGFAIALLMLSSAWAATVAAAAQ